MKIAFSNKPKHKTTYLFFALRELNILSFIAIVKSIREMPNCNSRCVLLRLSHSRCDWESTKLGAFDVIIDLPYISPSIHFISEVKKIYEFICALKVIKANGNVVLFISNIHQLIHFVLIRSLRKQFKTTNFKVIDVLFGLDVTKNIILDKQRTVLYNIFSLPLSSVVTWVYKSATTHSVIGFGYYPNLSDMVVCIEHKRPAIKGVRMFNNAPFPLRGMCENDDVVMQCSVNLPKGAVLVLLCPDAANLGICSDREGNLLAVQEMLQELVQCFGQDKVFIKLHPSSSVEQEHMYVDLINVNVLEKNVSAEEIFLKNRCRLQGVYAPASTSLTTASWLGIPAYNCGALFGYDRVWLSQAAESLGHINMTVDIITHADILEKQYPHELKYNQMDIRLCIDKWISILSQIEGVCKSPRDCIEK